MKGNPFLYASVVVLVVSICCGICNGNHGNHTNSSLKKFAGHHHNKHHRHRSGEVKHHGHSKQHHHDNHQDTIRQRVDRKELDNEKRLEKELSDMRALLKSMAPRCSAPSDCPSHTCCFQIPVNGGQCIVLPHREGQTCTAQCNCTRGLVCKNKDEEAPHGSQTGTCQLDGSVVGLKGAGFIPKMLVKFNELEKTKTEQPPTHANKPQ